MKKIRIISGIMWAFAGLLLIMILFFGFGPIADFAAKLPFMKINPNYSGGEVAQKLIAANCTIDIRKPVFDGLFGERESGFVQIDWRGKIPDEIRDTIDYNLDKVPDFGIFIDKKNHKTNLFPMTSKVKNISVSCQTSYGWSLRVKLIK